MAKGIWWLLWLNYFRRLNGIFHLWRSSDNKSTIIANNPIQHDRTKPNEKDRHFIKEEPHSGLVCTLYHANGN